MSDAPDNSAVAAATRDAPLFALVAGEPSGDTLGAELIDALRQARPRARFVGIAGPKMIAAGCEPWAHAEELAFMGIAEILAHLPRLWSLRRRMRQQLLAGRPDVFIGIDAPEFNLGLERQLHAAGLLTVQYVSPQVWAWRQGRVATIGASTDLVLCLLPFETRFYTDHGVRAQFVGHPLADRIPLQIDRAAARAALGLAVEGSVVALLPGSRRGEVARLGADFAATAAWLASRRPNLKFLAPMANAAASRLFAEAIARHAPGVAVQLFQGQSQVALAAADAVLVASGTATLETMLTGRPMVVAYRLAPLTALLLKTLRLVKVPYFSQPNLLLGRRVVPEFFQSEVRAATLGPEMERMLDDTAYREQLQADFAAVHRQLSCGGAARAAEAILHRLQIQPMRLRPMQAQL